ncbi:class I SAM-dependent methyltransferase [Streptomyces lunaelactis]|uniref:class I SAM-dependent methyltransferase n=1 Tax=Streptomyces lunaelactis TaxID=1535768 RepID=UPI001584D7D5|nr:class I SAM-dependent methyltransferase [Streptomyces lunaelactis]NUK24620.1 class I SAM-dependent methyltransferase [Streptomyces lunaelactis]
MAGVFATNPREAVHLVPEGVASYFEHPVGYDVDEAWEPHLHGLLGMPWPCPERQRAEALWEEAAGELRGRGLEFGRHTYGQYSDADLSLARAVWCTVVHLRPDVVVETGVARGITSRIILEALEDNGEGHLWSVDLPHPFEREIGAQTGAAVPRHCRERWSYIEGSSRRRLPHLLRRLGKVDVFVHDSLHTARNTRFEMDRIGRVLTPGGVMLIDDISTHQGFAVWASKASGARTLVCPSADGEGLFGVARTSPAATQAPGG